MNKVNICRSSTYNAKLNERVEDGVPDIGNVCLAKALIPELS